MNDSIFTPEDKKWFKKQGDKITNEWQSSGFSRRKPWKKIQCKEEYFKRLGDYIENLRECQKRISEKQKNEKKEQKYNEVLDKIDSFVQDTEIIMEKDKELKRMIEQYRVADSEFFTHDQVKEIRDLFSERQKLQQALTGKEDRIWGKPGKSLNNSDLRGFLISADMAMQYTVSICGSGLKQEIKDAGISMHAQKHHDSKIGPRNSGYVSL